MVIEKRQIYVAVLLFLLLLPLISAQETDCIYYFYGKNCEHCDDVDKYLQQLETKFPELKIQRFEVYFNKGNSNLLKQYFKSYNVPAEAQGIPAVFLSHSYFTTPAAIKNFLETRIKNNDNPNCPALNNPLSVGIVGENEPHNVIKTLTFSRTTGNALFHSLNTGMLALLLLLLALGMGLRNKHDIARRGFIFFGGIMTAYVLNAIGFFSWFNYSPATNFFSKSIGLLSIIIAAVRIKGFFSTWEELFGKMSERTQKHLLLIRLYLISPLSFFIIGLLGGLFTLGRTSNVFIALRSILLGNFQAAAFPLLIYYLFILLLPMLITLIVLFKIIIKIEDHAKKKGQEIDSDTHRSKKQEMWTKHNWKLLNFVVSCVMFVVGLLLLFV